MKHISHPSPIHLVVWSHSDVYTFDQAQSQSPIPQPENSLALSVIFEDSGLANENHVFADNPKLKSLQFIHFSRFQKFEFGEFCRIVPLKHTPAGPYRCLCMTSAGQRLHRPPMACGEGGVRTTYEPN